MTRQLFLKASRTRTISEHDIDSHLMTSKGGSPPLDILVRTSGVKRLSDFFLWQVILLKRDSFVYDVHILPVLRKYPDSVL